MSVQQTFRLRKSVLIEGVLCAVFFLLAVAIYSSFFFLDNPANQAVAGGFYQAFLAKVQAQGAAKEVTAHG